MSRISGASFPHHGPRSRGENYGPKGFVLYGACPGDGRCPRVLERLLGLSSEILAHEMEHAVDLHERDAADADPAKTAHKEPPSRQSGEERIQQTEAFIGQQWEELDES